MHARHWTLLCVAAALGAGLLLYLRPWGARGELDGDRPTSTPQAAGSPGESATAEPRNRPQQPARVESTGDGVAAGERGTRTPEVRTFLDVFVLDEEGAPIEGASVSSSSSHASESDPESRLTTTDERGVATIDPAGQTELVLWASHPDHLARAARIPDPNRTGPGDAQLMLPRTARTWVRVLTPTGNPAPDSIVVERPLRPDEALADGLRSSPDAWRAEAAALYAHFARELPTDDAGATSLHPCDFLLLVSAVGAAGASAPTLVLPGERSVTLRLLETARAHGRVAALGPEARTEDLRVEAYSRPRGSQRSVDRRLLASCSVEADATWGPVAIPVDPERSLVFRLHGGGVIPQEREVDPRNAPDPIFVEFTPELGAGLEVVVRAEGAGATRPLAGARVEFTWELDAGGTGSVARWTNDDGRVTLYGCPETTGRVTASATGFVDATVGPLTVPWPQVVELSLATGGTITGRCLQGEQPVSDFEVLLWQGDTRAAVTHAFRDRANGSFEIVGAPLGAVQAVAVSRAAPESEVRELEVRPDVTTEVEFELPPPVSGIGRVVDVVDGRPIPGATIRPLVSAALTDLGERGLALPVDADGRFSLELFPPKDALIEVDADGYAATKVQGTWQPGGGIDFGEIGLTRHQDLTVRVVTADGSALGTLWFLAQGAHSVPYRRFPPSGEVVVEDLPPGRYQLMAMWPNGDTLTRSTELVAGRPWVEELLVDPRAELVVEVIAPDATAPPPGLFVYATYAGLGGQSTTRGLDLPEDGRVTFPYLSAPEVWIEVVDADNRSLGLAHARFTGSEPRHVVVELAERGLALTITDASGEPLPEAQVDVATVDPEAAWSVYRDVDSQGRAVFRGIPWPEVLVHATEPAAGTAVEVMRLEPEGLTEHQLVLAGGTDLRVRVVDGAEPVVGAGVTLRPLAPTVFIAERQTGSDGIATWNRIQAGEYQVWIDHPGLWPARHGFTFDGAAQPVEVPVRRLGNLRLLLRDAQGQPLAGKPVSLRSVELVELVATWVAAHRVSATPADLTTDLAGELLLEGLPRGTYTVQLTTPAGEPVSVTVEVPARETATLPIVLE